MILPDQTPEQRIAQLEDLFNQAQDLINRQRAEIKALTTEIGEYQRITDIYQERLQAIIAKMEVAQ